MNERNVEALEALIREASTRQVIQALHLDYRRFASWLAEHGVLVPSSLTEQDVGRFDSGCGTGEYEVEDPVSVADWIALLERIAKGET